jgi:hypothetical protein
MVRIATRKNDNFLKLVIMALSRKAQFRRVAGRFSGWCIQAKLDENFDSSTIHFQ